MGEQREGEREGEMFKHICRSSLIRGWELFLLATGCFAPSKLFLNYLLAHIQGKQRTKKKQKKKENKKKEGKC